MSEECRDISVQEAVSEMVDGGIDKEDAHRRIRDAMRSMNCSHEWVDETPHSQACKKCKCVQVSDWFAHFGIERE